ncbi:MAG: SpoIIE family protein phosphatase [Clostridia bacterium]|nr:SpoIIE family protein phosphatase [Clostridia bacterium]
MSTNSKIKSLLFKVLAVLVLVGVGLYAGINYTIENVLESQEEALMTDRLSSDIQYLQDIIGDGDWFIDEEGYLCRGDVRLGNGTDKTANIAPFLELEGKTQTFSYVCKLTEDKDLKWVGDKKTGYQQGPYIRIAGSTKDADGNSIVGTYMDKKVTDILDREGHYEGAANVSGRPIFCVYQNLLNKDGKVVGCVAVGRSVEELSEEAGRYEGYIDWALLFLILLASVAVLLYFKRTSDTIVNIKKYLDRIGKGDFPEEPLKGKRNDELGLVINSINVMKKSLMEKERMGSELNVATNIQAGMLPSSFPAFPEREDFDVYATMNPAKEVGGDFYDFFMVDEDHLAIVIGDVSGKGVPAALFMVIAKTLIKNYAMMGLEPSEIFETVNNALCEGNEQDIFVTAWMAVVDLKTGQVKYVNAGHNPPLIKLGDSFSYIEQKPGLVLAAFENFKYKQGQFTIQPGDRIYLYTDGVTEATDKGGNLYGEDRLIEFINSRADAPIERVLHGIRRDIDDFVGEAEQFDDITMLLFDLTKKTKGKRLELDATLDSMGRVMDFIDTELDRLGANMKAKAQIDIAVDELYSNMARYAYGDQVGKVIISMSSEGKNVRIKFINSGEPFNPLEKEDPDVSLGLEDRDIGGLGIFISKNIMDKMEYEYLDGYNVITVEKNIE